jgi:transposase
MNVVALDAHSRSIAAASLDLGARGARTVVRRFSTDPTGIQKLAMQLYPEDVLLLEASTNSFWLHDQLSGHVNRCHILNTRKVTLQGNKSDSLDAKRLVQLLATHVTLATEDEMPTVYVPKAEIRELRALFAGQRSYRKVITQTKNRLHSLFRQCGIVFPRARMSTSAKWHAAIESHPLPSGLDFIARGLLRQLRVAEMESQSLLQQIIRKGLATYGQEVRLLMTIPGFSATTELTVLSDIGDIQRFAGVKQFSSNLRTCPSLHASNRTVHLGGINKASPHCNSLDPECESP